MACAGGCTYFWNGQQWSDPTFGCIGGPGCACPPKPSDNPGSMRTIRILACIQTGGSATAALKGPKAKGNAVRIEIPAHISFREPIDLMVKGTVVARLIPPSELSEKEKRRILQKGWQAVQKARANAGKLSAAEIRKEVDQAIQELHKGHGHGRR